MEDYKPRESYIRVATACPEVSVADVGTNVERIAALYDEAVDQHVSILTFPELSITGYTLGDLVQQTALLDQAEDGLGKLAASTKQMPTVMVVGLPVRFGNSLYNCAAVLSRGEIKGLVPKSNLPTYNEFYEERWYEVWNDENTTIDIAGKLVPFGRDLLFEVDGVSLGIEICEDLWVTDPPSRKLAEKGAHIIANPSASPEQIGKDDYRRALVAQQSGRLIVGYLYAGCDATESTMDIVMGGHQLIASNGQILAERQPFEGERLSVRDIDIDHIAFDRRKRDYPNDQEVTFINTRGLRGQDDLRVRLEKNPFLPEEDPAKRGERLGKIARIQAYGLAMRVRNTERGRVVLGLSGGLDSTLALMIACEAAWILGRNPSDMIQTLTMPGPASSEMTQDNAQRLAESLGIPNDVIPIKELVKAELSALGHDGKTQDITYENVQARARTTLLFNYGNKEHRMVLGTGDLSEIALGWCTFNGDHMSHYNVNASIPKTLVRHLVKYFSEHPDYKKATKHLEAILDTPVSPELTNEGEGITQKTEDLIGPYELHDFFLYHLVRWGDTPPKIQYLAQQTFADQYQPEEIEHWLSIFLNRFATSQFKRSVMPDGPKVGSVSLSPRGDWRMPSDLQNAALWT